MAIESTTALRCYGKKSGTNLPRLKSICSNNEKGFVVDSLSFSQITPPLIHRKLFATEKSKNVQVNWGKKKRLIIYFLRKKKKTFISLLFNIILMNENGDYGDFINSSQNFYQKFYIKNY